MRRSIVRSSLLLSELSEGESVMAGVHLLCLVLRLPAMKICDLFLQHSALVLHALLVLRHVLLHVVEPGVQLKSNSILFDV